MKDAYFCDDILAFEVRKLCLDRVAVLLRDDEQE